MECTPGPWHYVTSPVELGFIAVLAPTGHRVCGVDCTPEVNEEANARLIAAAPELLEVCNAVVLAILSRPGSRHISKLLEDMARAALVKAYGR